MHRGWQSCELSQIEPVTLDLPNDTEQWRDGAHHTDLSKAFPAGEQDVRNRQERLYVAKNAGQKRIRRTGGLILHR
jgi:hypothetical protein